MFATQKLNHINSTSLAYDIFYNPHWPPRESIHIAVTFLILMDPRDMYSSTVTRQVILKAPCTSPYYKNQLKRIRRRDMNDTVPAIWRIFWKSF